MSLSRPEFTTALDRPARVRGLSLLALLMLVLAILGGMIWRNLERLDRIQGYVSYSHRIQAIGLDLQMALTEALSGHAVKPGRITTLSARIRALMGAENHLAPDTPAQLGLVNSALTRVSALSPENGRPELFEALRVMHQVLDTETDQREKVLEGISRDTLAELELATGTLTVILLLAWIFMRRRILAPLHDLKQLLLNLAKEDFTPIDIRGLDPLLLPVFTSYNVMVTHLKDLEEAKRIHALSLEAEVRSATQALLEQQRTLARAERLAAIGELAAGLAHELRNPLAGITMGCANLRNDIQDPDQVERLDLMGAELKRMSRLLNDLLDQARQSPTPASRFNLAVLVRELIALTRYQIPPQISLGFNIPEDLHCLLPQSDLRQALLNLILNAAQAMDEQAGRIWVRARREGEQILLAVEDEGPGFKDEMLKMGIRPFSTGRARGTGLGLAIVQRFVREIGGQIKLANRVPDPGAVVTLSLPMSEES